MNNIPKSSRHDEHSFADKKHVAGIILAAGGSSRLGVSKQLLTWRGRTFLENVALASRNAGLSPVIVVTGEDFKQVLSLSYLFGAEVVRNPDWRSGQSSSMKAGIQQLGNRSQGAVFLMADQPQVSVTLICAIVELALFYEHDVISPIIDGHRTPPTYFSRRVFPQLLEVTGDQGGRALFSRFSPHQLAWLDLDMARDIDTLEDLNWLRSIE